LRSRAGKRARSFEERLEEGRGGVLAQRCLREMNDRIGKGKKLSDWEKERCDFFREMGMDWKEWEGQRMEGRTNFEELEERNWELQREENWRRIRDGRFNR